jgi:hypothetical protein
MGKTMNALKERIEEKEPNRRIPRISQKQKKYLRPGAKEKDRQINMAQPPNLTGILVMTAKIRDTKARILINSECLGNFVSPDFVKRT